MNTAPIGPHDGTALGDHAPDNSGADLQQRQGRDRLPRQSAQVEPELVQRFADLLDGVAALRPPLSPRPLPTSDDADADAEPGALAETPVQADRVGAADHLTGRGQRQDQDLDRQPDRDRGEAPKPADPLPSPMALFTRTPEPAPVREAAGPPPESITGQLALRIETLAVSTDQDGHRRVRLTLADNALPDTDVEVGHDAGELQVAFFCRRPEGRQALEAQAPQLADTLAQRLQRPVCVSVGGTQRDEPGRLTAQARPDERGSA